jgi:cation:H+ antiporter
MDGPTLLKLLLGLGLLIGGAELLVRGASVLARRLGIPPLIIGLTVVAFGTSAPELAVSTVSAFNGQSAIAVGNVVGSNVFNVLFILGLSALITPLVVNRQLVRLDVPIMLGASLLLPVLAWNGVVNRTEGIVLMVLLVAYLLLLVRLGRSPDAGAAEASAAGWGASVPVQLALVIGGLALLVLGSRWLVAGAVAMARAVGLSELIIGLTIVAAGTSLPEVAASVVAAVRGERDMAVGNVVGSNIFNILAVLGITALVAPEGVAVAAEALRFDIPVMIAVALACVPIFFTGFAIARWEGALFLAYYSAYTLFLVLDAQDHDAAPALGGFMLAFALPLTAVTLAVTTVHAWRRMRRERIASQG